METRSKNFGSYFFVGCLAGFVGSLLGKLLIGAAKSELITNVINLGGYSKKLELLVSNYHFPLNLIAILCIILAILIYRRI